MPPLRAPNEHAGVLAVPPLTGVGEPLLANRAAFADSSAQLLELPLVEARQRALVEVVQLAKEFTETLGVSAPAHSPSGIIATGHQPELFHPGVWVKNFAAYGLAQTHGLTPVHFLVDNDIAKAVSIKVPTGSRRSARTTRIALDHWTAPAPYEELAVQDEGLFTSFADRALTAMDEPGFVSLLADYWQEAVRLGKRLPLLGQRLAGARRRIEDRWGCHNLEVPLSRLCQSEAFARFACHVLFDLERFRELHNDLLHDYRKRHRIRSVNHPIPDLAVDGEWLEAPFWVWRPDDRQRERLFIRIDGKHIELRHAKTAFARLPSDPMFAIPEWRRCETRGYKLRTRALTTTMFVRLVLADIFIHGIGGAIYDELTDGLIRSFFNIEPPKFVTLSATLYLPPGMKLLTRPPSDDLNCWLRRLWYSPEHAVREMNPESDRLVHEKKTWVARKPMNPGAKRERFHAILQLNERLRPAVAEQRDALLSKVKLVEEQRAADAVWRNREYAFCIYPEDMLNGFFQKFRGEPGA